MSPRESLASRVLHSALLSPSSWASTVLRELPAPFAASLPPFPCPAVQAWLARAHQLICARAVRRYVSALQCVPSLSVYAELHPLPSMIAAIYGARLDSALVREWSLARIGHHPFDDGHPFRHLQLPPRSCACGASPATLSHALHSCPCRPFAEERARWFAVTGLH